MPVTSLKVVNSANPNVINADGYVALVENLVMSMTSGDHLEEFEEDYGPRQRPNVLKNHASQYPINSPTNPNAPTNATITQLNASGSASVVINANNCRIVAERDRRMTANRPSRVSLALPEDKVDDATLGYINDFVKEFLRVRTNDPTADLPPASDPDFDLKARKFMFGVFMLTKCR